MLGKKHTAETRAKMSAKRKGELHPNWRGGHASGPNRAAYMREKNRIWIENNRERKYWLNNLRRAMLAKAEGSYTYGEWLECKKLHGKKCARCGKPEGEVVLTVDHIIPLSKGGSNYISNIQPLCRSCNSKKNAN